MVSISGVARRIPRLRRVVEQRDEYRRRVTSLEQEAIEALSRIRMLEAQSSGPSFRRYLEAERRTHGQWQQVFGGGHGLNIQSSPDPRFALADKLRGKALAQSTGIDAPAVYRTWPRAANIDLDGLPERFVLKSAGGASSHGVLPLERVAGGHRVISTSTVLDTKGIHDHFRHKARAAKVRSPYFAEEFLSGVTGSDILEDVKVYTFYGEIGHILLRRVGEHGVPSSIRSRYIDTAGADLGPVSLSRTVDPTIPIPENLAEAVAAASKLSTAAKMPFLRVDLYETDRGIVFGEFTPHPGGAQKYVPQHDRQLGILWEQARLRLDADLSREVAPIPDADTALRQVIGG